MKDDYSTNSHYLTYTLFYRRLGELFFLNLGVKGLIAVTTDTEGVNSEVLRFKASEECAAITARNYPSTILHSVGLV